MSNTLQDFDLWLDIATQKLPGKVATLARHEFEAHYADAVADYQEQGRTPSEAHQAALAGLGDPQVTAKALRDTHLARRRYLRAALVSMIWPLYPFAFFFLMLIRPFPFAFNSLLYYSGILFIVLYVFETLRIWLARHFDHDYLKHPRALLTWSSGVYLGPLLLFELLSGQPASAHHIFIDDVTFFGTALGLISASGGIVTGFAAVWIAYELSRVANSLYGLRLALVVFLALLGVSMSGLNLALVLGRFLTADLISLVFFIVSFITFALLALLFFRAALRSAGLPIQVA